jgi:hypothetical protein
VNEYVSLFDVARGDVKIGDRSLTVTALVEDFLARERGALANRASTTVTRTRRG